MMISPAIKVKAQDDTQAAYKLAASKANAPTSTLRYGSDDLRSGQLRIPEGKGPFPVAVVVHGGCWTKGFDTLAGMAAVSEALAKRGIATWNIEYRQLGDAGAGWPGTFEDVGAGIDHLVDLAKTHPLNLKQVTIVGHSAGAHLALWGAS
ncbi:MAG: alpha/beta fold hydrolase, partial [Sphingorhabdus lacus]